MSKVVIEKAMGTVEKEFISDEVLVMGQGNDGLIHVKPEGKISIGDGLHIDQTKLSILRDLKKMYSDRVFHVIPDKIMVIINETWKLTEKTNPNSRWGCQVKRAPKWLRIFAGYEYVMEVRLWWINNWTDAQLHAAVLSQMLRISSKNGSVLAYNEHFSSQCLATFGEGYLKEGIDIPDCLEQKVVLHAFEEASHQVRIDEVEAEQSDLDFSEAVSE